MSVWTTPLNWITGRIVTASDLNAQLSANMNYLYGIRARKGTDQSVSSANTGSTLVNVSGLDVAVAASETWVGVYHVFYDGATAADFKSALICPSGGTFNYGGQGLPTSAASDPDQLLVNTDAGGGSGSVLNWGCIGTGQILYVPIAFSLSNGLTGGNVTLQMAQTSSNATSTTVRGYSFVVAHRIGG